MKTYNVVAIAGSINQDSLNKALIQSMIDLAPGELKIQVLGVEPLPFYSRTIEAAGPPQSVLDFKSAIHNADGVIISTPEYDHSIPGVLKNALDWAGREASGVVLNGKKVAITGATTGNWGTVRSQQALRLVLYAHGAVVMSRHALMVPKAKELYKDGKLVDKNLEDKIKMFLEGYLAFLNIFN
jgi:chromate reductase